MRTRQFHALRSSAVLLTLTLFALLFSTLGHTEPARAPFEGVRVSDFREKQSLRILFFGDAGTGKQEQLQVGRVMNQVCIHRGCDLALMLGDNIYENGVKSIGDRKFETHFELPYEAFGRFDFWNVAGNHDWRGSVAAQIAYSARSPRWRQPDYHFAVPNLPSWVRIYGFDTEKITPSQAVAARPHLCDARARWKIGYGHHPIHSSGKHGDSRATTETLLPLFEECGVQLYLAGHDHHQEHITGRSFEQIVNGAAAKLRKVKTIPYKEGDDRRQNYARSVHGFGILNLTPDHLEMKFYDLHGRELYSWETTPDTYGLERAEAVAF